MASVTRQATSDVTNTGGFTTAPLFSKINDSSDSTLIVGVTQGGGRATFGFTTLALSSSDAVSSVDIHYRHRSTTTGNAYAHGSCIKVGSTYYGRGQTAGWDAGSASGVGSGSAIADRIYQGTTNPATGIAWTYAEVNALTEFGISSNDFNPDANFYQCDITVNYTTLSAVGDTVQTIWNTRVALGDTSQSIWHTRAALGDTSQYIWNTKTTVSDTLQSIWNTLTVIGDSSQFIWNVRQAIGQTRQTIWNVLASSTVVGNTIQTVWNVTAVLGKTSQKIWNINAVLGNTIQTVWRNRATLGKVHQVVWNVLTVEGVSTKNYSVIAFLIKKHR